MRLPQNKKLLSYARDLRKKMTKEERHLWYDFLREHPAHFRRQQIIGNYIADFYCHASKLVIELDGSQHYEPDAITYDKEREAFFTSKGIRVLRYSNADINQRFRAVCEDILEHL